MLLTDNFTAAHENWKKNRGTAEQWFEHRADYRPGPRKPRIRPESCGILLRHQQSVTTAALAGATDRPSLEGEPQQRTNRWRRSVRTAEAEAIARRSKEQTDRWFDFADNQVAYQPAKQYRIGAGEDAKEIVQRMHAVSDWFKDNSRHPSPPPERKGSLYSTLGFRKRNEENDWFVHRLEKGSVSSGYDVLPTRVNSEGIEYALRDRGTMDLLHMQSQDVGIHNAPYACPSLESQQNALRSVYGVNVAACLGRHNDTDREEFAEQSRPSTANVRGFEAEVWRTRGREGSNIFRAFTEAPVESCVVPRVRPEAEDIYKKSTTGSQVSNCLAITNSSRVGLPDDPPELHVHRIRTEEGEMSLKRNQGQMDQYLGRLAQSITKPSTKRMQPRSVRSADGQEHAFRARGLEAKELLTHDRLAPEPVKSRLDFASEQVREIAERNRSGLVRNLLSKELCDNVPLTGVDAPVPIRLRSDAVEFAVRSRGDEMKQLLRLN